MSRIAYVNGRYVPHHRAGVSIDDRGYQFGDGVYEVISIIGGKPVDPVWHLDRLEYSLGEIGIPMPMSRAALRIVLARVLALNHVRDGLVYFQVTRGVMRRDHVPKANLRPQLVITAKSLRRPPADAPPKVIKVMTAPDIRWKRRDIKTIQLLPNCLARTRAGEAGAAESALVDDSGNITECGAANMWIVSPDGELITRPLSRDILGGITRKAVMELAAARNIRIVERGFTPAEAAGAAEAFITNSSTLITPVGMIDDARIGDGEAGPVTLALRQAFLERIAAG